MSGHGMIAKGKTLNDMLYNYVWSNMTYGEIKEKIGGEPGVSYMTNVKKALDIMSGYFGMEKCRYQFRGYTDKTVGIIPKTGIGRTFAYRIKDETKFSDVLEWLEEYASGLGESEEKHYIQEVILPYHRKKMRDAISER